MRRAAVSIAANIAEGAERIGILTPAQAQPLITELKEISAMRHGLIKSLKT